MNKYLVIFVSFLCYSFFISFASCITTIFAYDPSDFYDEECADKVFDNYVEDAEPEYDKYLDNAKDIPIPTEEGKIDNYLESLEPLAEKYIDNLEPYADDYIKNLEDCLE